MPDIYTCLFCYLLFFIFQKKRETELTLSTY